MMNYLLNLDQQKNPSSGSIWARGSGARRGVHHGAQTYSLHTEGKIRG